VFFCSCIQGLLRAHARTHNLSEVRDVEKRMIGLNAIQAPLVDYGIDERQGNDSCLVALRGLVTVGLRVLQNCVYFIGQMALRGHVVLLRRATGAQRTRRVPAAREDLCRTVSVGFCDEKYMQYE